MKDKAIDHRRFLASHAEWTRQHNEEPSQTRLANKNDLKTVQTLVTKKATGGRFENPKMEFVYESDWDSNDGEFDASKVVEEEVFGVMRKGIWKSIGNKDTLRLQVTKIRCWCTTRLKMTAQAYSLPRLSERRMQH